MSNEFFEFGQELSNKAHAGIKRSLDEIKGFLSKNPTSSEPTVNDTSTFSQERLAKAQKDITTVLQQGAEDFKDDPEILAMIQKTQAEVDNLSTTTRANFSRYKDIPYNPEITDEQIARAKQNFL